MRAGSFRPFEDQKQAQTLKPQELCATAEAEEANGRIIPAEQAVAQYLQARAATKSIVLHTRFSLTAADQTRNLITTSVTG